MSELRSRDHRHGSGEDARFEALVASGEDYYALLQVTAAAQPAVISAAYRTLMREHHPDRNASEESQRISARLNEAFAIIGNASRRAAYDAERAKVALPSLAASALRENADVRGRGESQSVMDFREIVRFLGPHALIAGFILTLCVGTAGLLLLVQNWELSGASKPRIVLIDDDRSDAKPE